MHVTRFRLFLILLFASIVLMTLQNRWGPLRPFEFLNYPLDLFNEGYTVARTAVLETLQKYTLREERLREMQRQLLSMKLKEQRYHELVLENQRLKEALAMKKSLGGYVATAKVVSRGIDRWSNTFVINKGSDDAVRKDMAVITGDGLLGKVQRVRDTFSNVLLLDDPGFSVAVRLHSSRAEAVLSGSGLNSCVLKYVSAETEVEEGDLVITSGMDGIFPEGIPAGFVTAVETVKDAMFHRIEVRPLVDTRTVEEVIIIKR